MQEYSLKIEKLRSMGILVGYIDKKLLYCPIYDKKYPKECKEIMQDILNRKDEYIPILEQMSQERVKNYRGVLVDILGDKESMQLNATFFCKLLKPKYGESFTLDKNNVDEVAKDLAIALYTKGEF